MARQTEHEHSIVSNTTGTAPSGARKPRLNDRSSETEVAPALQSDRFIAKARELGLDEREETFDAALKKVARRKLQGKDAANRSKKTARPT